MPQQNNWNYLNWFSPNHFAWLAPYGQGNPHNNALPSLFQDKRNNPAGLGLPPMPEMNGGGIYNAPTLPFGTGVKNNGKYGGDFGIDPINTIKPPPTPTSTPPPGATGFGAGTNRGGVLPQNPNATKVTQPNASPNGSAYFPKPTGSANQAAYRPIRFPGVEASGGNWAKFQDGSFVDYSSGAWKRAAGIQFSDEQQKQLWDAVPDSWKADMAGWDAGLRDAWMQAMKNPNVGGIFQGKWMTGKEAAALIAQMAHDAADQAAQQKQQQKKQQQQIDEANRAIRPTPNYVPSPYI